MRMMFLVFTIVTACEVVAGDASDVSTDRVRLGGRVGAKAEELFESRLLGWRGRTDYFDETLRAFETHFDDRHPRSADLHRSQPQPDGLWQGEYWGKTMLSYCALARYSGRSDVREIVRARTHELIRRFQREDGYLCTYENPDFVVGWNWNVWSRKYTMWALIEAYDLLGDSDLLDAAVKMGDHLLAQLERLDVKLAQTGCFVGLPSMSILKPMVLLYERTGEKRFLDFARSIVEDNDREDGRAPNLIRNAFGPKPVCAWYPQPNVWAKAYELMSVCEGLLEYSKATGEERPAEAVRRIWDKLAEDELNALGSVGFHDHFVGARSIPNVMTELCDVIHWMRLCRYLDEATGNPKYLDAWECAFLNAFLAGVYRGGQWGAHDVRGHGRRHLTGMFEVGMTYHFCCIDNAARGFCDWADRQVDETEDVIRVNFFTDFSYARNGTKVEVRGDFPVGDHVTVRVCDPKRRTVVFRRPGWSRDAPVVTKKEGREGDVYELAFDLRPSLERVKLLPRSARELGWNPDGVFEMTVHNPEMRGFARKTAGVRICRGPLVLAKAAAVGDGDKMCFTDIEGLDSSWRVTIRDLVGSTTWGAWTLTLSDGKGTSHQIPVCDFATAADYDDPRNAFSIWF